MPTTYTAGRFQGFDSNGDPLSGGLLYTYLAGTTTPQATYTSSTLATPNANPVVLDSAGRASVWLTPSANYRMVLKTSADATVTDDDNISDSPGNFSATTGAGLIGYDYALTYAADTVGFALSTMYVNAKEFGAVGDNVADDTSALNAAAAHATANSLVLYIPAGTYKTTGTVALVNCHVMATGAEIRPDATVTTGVEVGSSGVICDGKIITGLRVRGVGWTSHPAGAAAWKFLNASGCTFNNIVGNRMEKGARVEPPTGARVAYCEWRNPYFHRCSRNFDIYVNGTGFAAGNTVWGGRFQLTSVELAEAHVYAEKTSGSGSMNDWQWMNCRMESYSGATVPRWAMRMLRADFWRITDPRTEGDWADADFEFSANSTDCVVEMLYDNNITVIDANGTNVVRYQRTEGMGGIDQTDPAASCIKRYYSPSTVRVQILSDGVALPGLALGSIASESAVELVWVPTSSSVGFRVGGSLVAEADADSWRPATDGTINLGESARKWNTVYAATGAINTSDEREKRDVLPITDAVLDAWADVNFVSYKFISAVDKKDKNARIHFGVIAQQVKRAFEARGIDPFAFGLLCYDEWDEIPAVVDPSEKTSNGTKPSKVSAPAIPAGNRYGVRYEEALVLESALMRRTTQRLQARIAALEA